MQVRKALDDALHGRITALSDQGKLLEEQGRPEAAIARWRAAYAVLPTPPQQWDAATWLLTAIGDVLFSMGRFDDAREALRECMHCPDAIGNPFIHLRLGQVQFELGNLVRAKDELARAFLIDRDVFSHEDPKYEAWILQFLDPPAGQESW